MRPLSRSNDQSADQSDNKLDKKPSSLALVILTWNASEYIEPLFRRIFEQSLRPDTILVIDSSSTDDTRERLKAYPIKLHIIPQNEFNHGTTRELAVQMVEADKIIFMTQDALPASADAFKHLIDALDFSPDIGCAYGRQLPAKGASPLSAHLRLFNYPEQSIIKSQADKAIYGIKTCFNSDSFAAYKKTALQQAGGFPACSIVGEDVYVAANMLLQGLKIHYCATAQVFHSHEFSLKQEFLRYFSIGVFHRRENWIIKHFSTPKREGRAFVLSQLRYLIKNRCLHHLPRAIASWAVKWAGYRLGYIEHRLPARLKVKWGLKY